MLPVVSGYEMARLEAKARELAAEQQLEEQKNQQNAGQLQNKGISFVRYMYTHASLHA